MINIFKKMKELENRIERLESKPKKKSGIYVSGSLSKKEQDKKNSLIKKDVK